MLLLQASEMQYSNSNSSIEQSLNFIPSCIILSSCLGITTNAFPAGLLEEGAIPQP